MELMIPRSEVEVFKGLFEKAFKAADPDSESSHIQFVQSAKKSQIRDHGFIPTW
jgi:hypothetical protein